MTNKEIKNKLRNLGTQLDEFIMVCLVRDKHLLNI